MYIHVFVVLGRPGQLLHKELGCTVKDGEALLEAACVEHGLPSSPQTLPLFSPAQTGDKANEQGPVFASSPV